MPKKPEHYTSAAERAHGTHGKGDDREVLLSPEPTLQGNEGDPESKPDSVAWQRGQTGNLSGAGWGSEAAGGSVSDKRSPKKTKDGGKKKKS